MHRLLTFIALVVAFAVTLLLPAITAVVGYGSLGSILRTEVEINARLVTQMVNANPELWMVEVTRLEELLKRRPRDGALERRIVTDLQGEVVSEVNDPLQAPTIEAVAPVHDAGQVVGWLTIRRSLRPLMIQAAWVGLIGLLLGSGVYLTLKLLPLGALRRAESRLHYEATHDALTGLPNRALFLDRLELAMGRARRNRRWIALLFMDLDGFKDVNDRLGHQAGDDLLRHVAGLLTGWLQDPAKVGRAGDQGELTVARLGGDEFTLIIEQVERVEALSSMAEEILAVIGQPIRIAGHEVLVSGSIGIAIYAGDSTGCDALLRQADMAMYKSKDDGRNRYHFFNDDLDHAIQQRIRLEHDLRCRGIVALAATRRGHRPRRSLYRDTRGQPADRAGGRVGHRDGLRATGRYRSPGPAEDLDGRESVGAPVS